MAKNPEIQRAAAKRHYTKNKEAMKLRAREYTILNRKRLREYIRDIKSQPCMDCRKSFPYYAMDFDHREGEDKESCVANMIARSVGLERLKSEISKCDIVCAVCHRIRTHDRLHAG